MESPARYDKAIKRCKFANGLRQYFMQFHVDVPRQYLSARKILARSISSLVCGHQRLLRSSADGLLELSSGKSRDVGFIHISHRPAFQYDSYFTGFTDCTTPC